MKKNILYIAISACVLWAITPASAQAFCIQINNGPASQKSLKITVEAKTHRAFCHYGYSSRVFISYNKPTYSNCVRPSDIKKHCRVDDYTPYYVSKVSIEDLETNKKWHIDFKQGQIALNGSNNTQATINITPGINNDTLSMIVSAVTIDGKITNSGTLSPGPF